MQRLLRVPFLLFIILVLTVLVFAILLLQIPNPFAKPTLRVDVSRPKVLKQIQELGRIETTQFTLEKVIDTRSNGNQFQQLLSGNRILLVAFGRVTTGVDLSQVSDKDVDILGKNLRINLPKAAVFDVALDIGKTKIYDRQSGLGHINEKDLDDKTKKAAEDAIKREACEAGILALATKNAKDRMIQIYKLVGFTEVFVDAPEAVC